MPIPFQPGYVRFIKWNGVIYCLDSEAPEAMSPALQSSRYRGSDKSIIDAAINDLSDAEDGSWVFGKEMLWIKLPLSLPEIVGVAQFDGTISSIVDASTPIRPLFPSDMEAYQQEVKEGF